jgi:hypothetical protein
MPGIESITMLTSLHSICSPMLRNVFSGYLSIHPLMFVWDQYVISADVAGYHEELLPIICAIIFMVLRDQIFLVKSVIKIIFFKNNFKFLKQTKQK